MKRYIVEYRSPRRGEFILDDDGYPVQCANNFSSPAWVVVDQPVVEVV